MVKLKKFKKEVMFEEFGQDKMMDFLHNFLGIEGDIDLTDCEEVVGHFNFLYEIKDDYPELNLTELKAFVGKGICFKLNENIWYNVSLGTSDGEDILECEYLA
jgi:hypothetical protein